MSGNIIPVPIGPGTAVDVRHLKDRPTSPWVTYRVDGVVERVGGIEIRLVNPDDAAEVIMLTFFYSAGDDAAAGEQLGFEVE